MAQFENQDSDSDEDDNNTQPQQGMLDINEDEDTDTDKDEDDSDSDVSDDEDDTEPQQMWEVKVIKANKYSEIKNKKEYDEAINFIHNDDNRLVDNKHDAAELMKITGSYKRVHCI